jgi:hypothetical protein
VGIQASAVVLSWRRVVNLPPIVCRLLDQPFVGEVRIWHQDPARPLSLEHLLVDDSRLTVVNAAQNYFTWGRFLACLDCQNNLILTQDDDQLPRNWPAIYQAALDNPDRLVSSMRAGHIAEQAKWTWGQAQEVLLGWGSAFDRRWIEPAFRPYLERWGIDNLLMRKADRIFTSLLNRPHCIMEADVEQLWGDSLGGLALYSRPDHWRLTRDARERIGILLGQANG